MQAMLPIVKIMELHDKAMDIASLADIKKSQGETIIANELYRKAKIYASRAASEVHYSNYYVEPTSSIIFLSAASLAIMCENCREASLFINLAFMGQRQPPEEIKKELLELLNNI